MVIHRLLAAVGDLIEHDVLERVERTRTEPVRKMLSGGGQVVDHVADVMNGRQHPSECRRNVNLYAISRTGAGRPSARTTCRPGLYRLPRLRVVVVPGPHHAASDRVGSALTEVPRRAVAAVADDEVAADRR